MFSTAGIFDILMIVRRLVDISKKEKFFKSVELVKYVFQMRQSLQSHSKSRANRPLFVAVPMSGENSGWFLITGSMPANTDYEDSNQKRSAVFIYKFVIGG